MMKSPCKMLVIAGLFAVAGLDDASADNVPHSEPAIGHYKAAVQGSAEAQANLGALYARGAGVAQSDAAAFQWFMRAAEQGHPKAQVMLSDIWANGRGVPRNDPIAYKWAWLANARASDSTTRRHAERLLEMLAARLSRAEITEARRRATEWKPEVEVVPNIDSPPPAIQRERRPVRGAMPAPEQQRAVATARHAAKTIRTMRPPEASASSLAARAKVRSAQRHARPRLVGFARRLGL